MTTFFDISGANKIIHAAKYVSLGNDENFEKAGKELKAFEILPDSEELANQFLSPPISLSEEDTFNW